jgi:hypothetical protein
MTPFATLDQIETRLADTTPIDLIDQLMPALQRDAVTWARRLPHWDEYRRTHTDQAVSIARVVSRRAMREFGLALSEDGRVVDRYAKAPSPARELTFLLAIDGQKVQVTYTTSYFPTMDRDSFEFDARCNPLSESGHWHQFVDHDAVEAAGGPKEFAARYAEAKVAGREESFVEQFTGRFLETKRSGRRKLKPTDKPAKPIVGEHTARVIDAGQAKSRETSGTDPGVRQDELF